jgi:cytochrome P450
VSKVRRKGGMTQAMQRSNGLFEQFEAFVQEDPSVDRWAIYRDCRAEPVFYSPTLDAWVLSRYDDVLRVLKESDCFSTLDGGPGSTVYGRTILHMQGDEHTKKSRIAARQMQSARATERIEAFLVDACRQLTDAMAMAPETVDLKKAYCMWIPLLVIGELMAVEDPERFCEWYSTITAGSMSSIGHPERRERALVAVRELGEFLRPLIDERRLHPGDDVISDYCRAEYGGQPIPDAEIIAMAGLLLTAGVETTERGLASIFCHLFEHRETWDAVRADRTLVESAAAEGLRMMPPIHAVTRQATSDVGFDGRTLPAGTKFFALVASANRDETQFASSDTYDPARFRDDAGRQFTAAGRILPFGAGMHHCTGSQLVRVEMRQGINALMDRVEHATFAHGVPGTVGFLLRSPATLEVVLTPA